jgi:hypothetical protein
LTPFRAGAYRPRVRLWIVLWLLAAAQDPDLAAAERAYDDARFEEVLPELKTAFTHPLNDADLARAYQLKALTEAAFDNRPASVEAFRHLLGLAPGYEPDAAAGPKVRSLWEHARRLGPIGTPDVTPAVKAAPPARPPAPKPLPPAAVPKAEEPEPEATPWYGRWYVWGGAAGVVAVGVGIGVAASMHPVAPAGNLGTGSLR